MLASPPQKDTTLIQYTAPISSQQNGFDPSNAPAAPAPSSLLVPQPRLIRFSALAKARGPEGVVPIEHALPWNELSSALIASYSYRTEKLDGPLISPATFTADETGRKRKKSEHVEAIHFLALDFDDVPADKVTEILRSLEAYAAITYTTWKQPQASGLGLMRFRAMLPMSRSCSAAEWPVVYLCAVRDFGASALDTSCSDPNRFYFTPALPLDQNGNPCSWAAQTWRSQGTQAWDVDAALAKPRAAENAPVIETAEPFAAVTRAQVMKIAKKLAASARPETSSVGMCLVGALEGGPMGEKSARHAAMLSVTMQLAREFGCYTIESIANQFADSFAAMDRDGVQEPSRDHFIGLMRSAIAKNREERATRARSGLLYTDKGVLKPIVANVLQIMSGAEWDGVLAFNEFANEISKLRDPPCRDIDRAQKPSVCFDDADGIRAAAWFQAQHRLDASPELVMTAAVAAAQRKTFHPVRDWLEALSWDGASRHHMLPACFGAEDSAYTRAVLSRFLISAVARVFKPGCKVDTVLCLVGGQGKKKSTALSVLASNVDWFSDSPIDLDSKDGMQALNGKWIIEIPELDSFKGKSATRIKSFASSATDNYRPSYGRAAKPFPRHCVFAATTNEPEFLTDQTGNRRFWPVKCGAIDLELIKVAREQLWAEAVALYRAGAPWWLQESDLEASASEAQAEHTEQDPWVVHLTRWVATRTEPFTVADALSGALELRPNQQDRRTNTRAGMLLSKLGWGPRQLRGEGGKRTRRYELTDETKWAAAQAELGITAGKLRAPALVDVSQYAPALASGGALPGWAKATA